MMNIYVKGFKIIKYHFSDDYRARDCLFYDERLNDYQ